MCSGSSQLGEKVCRHYIPAKPRELRDRSDLGNKVILTSLHKAKEHRKELYTELRQEASVQRTLLSEVADKAKEANKIAKAQRREIQDLKEQLDVCSKELQALRKDYLARKPLNKTDVEQLVLKISEQPKFIERQTELLLEDTRSLVNNIKAEVDIVKSMVILTSLHKNKEHRKELYTELRQEASVQRTLLSEVADKAKEANKIAKAQRREIQDLKEQLDVCSKELQALRKDYLARKSLNKTDVEQLVLKISEQPKFIERQTELLLEDTRSLVNNIKAEVDIVKSMVILTSLHKNKEHRKELYTELRQEASVQRTLLSEVADKAKEANKIAKAQRREIQDLKEQLDVCSKELQALRKDYLARKSLNKTDVEQLVLKISEQPKFIERQTELLLEDTRSLVNNIKAEVDIVKSMVILTSLHKNKEHRKELYTELRQEASVQRTLLSEVADKAKEANKIAKAQRREIQDLKEQLDVCSKELQALRKDYLARKSLNKTDVEQLVLKISEQPKFIERQTELLLEDTRSLVNNIKAEVDIVKSMVILTSLHKNKEHRKELYTELRQEASVQRTLLSEVADKAKEANKIAKAQRREIQDLKEQLDVCSKELQALRKDYLARKSLNKTDVEQLVLKISEQPKFIERQTELLLEDTRSLVNNIKAEVDIVKSMVILTSLHKNKEHRKELYTELRQEASVQRTLLSEVADKAKEANKIAKAQRREIQDLKEQLDVCSKELQALRKDYLARKSLNKTDVEQLVLKISEQPKFIERQTELLLEDTRSLVNNIKAEVDIVKSMVILTSLHKNKEHRKELYTELRQEASVQRTLLSEVADKAKEANKIAKAQRREIQDLKEQLDVCSKELQALRKDYLARKSLNKTDVEQLVLKISEQPKFIERQTELLLEDTRSLVNNIKAEVDIVKSMVQKLHG
ncbi:hypothetical protein OPV22_020092 [Ensete ventricosum]|uniref:Uncharacterized protein n=1 Tax=Ensete ventricosum TaxID=4639 RepID=A0AAV8QM85_ENSVE|nr:hypothetical protein OPV22_020092 [Ensete ventricosum]